MMLKNALRLMSKYGTNPRRKSTDDADSNESIWLWDVNGGEVSFVCWSDRPQAQVGLVRSYSRDERGRPLLDIHRNLVKALRMRLNTKRKAVVKLGETPVEVMVDTKYEGRWLKPYTRLWVGHPGDPHHTLNSSSGWHTGTFHPELEALVHGSVACGEYAPVLDWLMENQPQELRKFLGII